MTTLTSLSAVEIFRKSNSWFFIVVFHYLIPDLFSSFPELHGFFFYITGSLSLYITDMDPREGDGRALACGLGLQSPTITEELGLWLK